MYLPAIQLPRPCLPVRELRKSALVAVCMLCFLGCERPDIVDPGRGNFVASPESGLSLNLVNASFRLDGRLRSDRINLSTDRFVILFVFVKSKGLYIISADEMDGMQQAGRFAGSRLTVALAGTRIEFEGRNGDLLGYEPDRTAWVQYLRDYDLLGPDAKSDDAVIGLAARKELIPGFAENMGG